jgi:hypothetical protein
VPFPLSPLPPTCEDKCCEGEDSCILIRVYTYACCFVNAYLYVRSECVIDEIRINGVVIANPGSYVFGGMPTTLPTFTVNGETLQGVQLKEERCGNCNPAQYATGTSHLITTPAPDCSYTVEVDTCGETKTCTLFYCIERQLDVQPGTYNGAMYTLTCNNVHVEPSCSDVFTTTDTLTTTISGFSTPGFQVDYCVPGPPTTLSIGTWSAVELLVQSLAFTPSGLCVGTPAYSFTSSVENVYNGVLSLFIGAPDPCTDGGGHPTPGRSRAETQIVRLLFTGNVTTTSTNLGGNGQVAVAILDYEDLEVAQISIPRCNEINDYLLISWTRFCGGLTPLGSSGIGCMCAQPHVGLLAIGEWC